MNLQKVPHLFLLLLLVMVTACGRSSAKIDKKETKSSDDSKHSHIINDENFIFYSGESFSYQIELKDDFLIPQFEIIGGSDKAFFSIDEYNGTLTPDSPLSVCNPNDHDGDNNYNLTISMKLDGKTLEPFHLVINVRDNIDPLVLDYSLEATSPAEGVCGGAVNDTLTGSDSADSIFGRNGADTIMGLGGVDRIYGGAGNDIIDAGTDADTVEGDEGDDEITGGLGNDRLYGENGHDIILGGNGTDTIDGGAGNDEITGGGANDSLTGGAGQDKFFYPNLLESRYGTNDVITDFNTAEDKIYIPNVTATLESGYHVTNVSSAAQIQADIIAANASALDAPKIIHLIDDSNGNEYIIIKPGGSPNGVFNIGSDAFIQVPTGTGSTLIMENFQEI
jgi:hypothetical protein